MPKISLRTRRRFLGMGIFSLVSLSTACATGDTVRKKLMIWNQRRVQSKHPASLGLLLAQPKEPTTTAKIGLQPLGLDGERDGFLYVPTSYRAEHPAPLVLMLHGAGGKAQYGLAPFEPLADAAGLVLLAVDSRLQTWDVIMSRYGSDIRFIDRALAYTSHIPHPQLSQSEITEKRRRLQE